jgi:hypothetical protein
VVDTKQYDEQGWTCLGEAGLLVEEGDYAHGALLNQVEALLVVGERNLAPVNAFPLVLKLLELEDVLVEVVLKLLITVVNAKLLERVHVEVLEPKYIEHLGKEGSEVALETP